MKISIAMATYNGEKFIRQQLDSFVNQSRQPDELVITDDGSTDRTLQIIEEFSRQAPFEVHYSRNPENIGYAANFNAALMQASGELIFLSDQDDVWFPEKIEKIVDLSEGNEDILIFMNDAILTDGELNKTGLTKLGQIRSAGMRDEAFVMGCCCAVRRELLDLCMPIPFGYTSHDAWITGFAAGLEAKMIVDTPYQLYRRHGNNESIFIVNNTTKVTSFHIYLNYFSRIINRRASKHSRRQIQQMEIFLQGVRRGAKRDNGKYRQQFESFIKGTESRIECEKAREIIRAKPLPFRFGAVIGYLCEGGYRHASGIQSAMRDLMG